MTRVHGNGGADAPDIRFVRSPTPEPSYPTIRGPFHGIDLPKDTPAGAFVRNAVEANAANLEERLRKLKEITGEDAHLFIRADDRLEEGGNVKTATTIHDRIDRIDRARMLAEDRERYDEARKWSAVVDDYLKRINADPVNERAKEEPVADWAKRTAGTPGQRPPDVIRSQEDYQRLYGGHIDESKGLFDVPKPIAIFSAAGTKHDADKPDAGTVLAGFWPLVRERLNDDGSIVHLQSVVVPLTVLDRLFDSTVSISKRLTDACALLPNSSLEQTLAPGTYGARKKYDRDNWLTVVDGVNRYYQAAGRHALRMILGEEKDDEGLIHSECLTWCIWAGATLVLRNEEERLKK